MPWEKKQLNKSEVVSSLQQATALVGPVVSIGITFLEAVKAYAETLATLAIAVSDPAAVALQAAIDAARAVLEDLTKGAGCYFLALPIRDVDLETESPIMELVGATKTLGSGGNLGYLEELAGSLLDQNDILRPQFDEDAHVAGVMCLYGSDSYIKLTELIRHLVWLFTGGNPGGIGSTLDDMRMPVPSNLSAQFVPKIISRVEEIENRLTLDDIPVHPYAVKIKWKPRGPTFSLFNSLSYSIENIVVMRAEKSLLKMSHSQRQQHIIKEFNFNQGLTNTFYDDTIELGKRYFYAVGYLLDENTEPFHVSQIRVTVPTKFPLLPSRGIPPDWLMAPGPLAFIPPISDFVAKVNEYLDALEEGNKNARDNIEEYTIFLEAEISRYTSWVEDLLHTVQAIVEALEFPDVYVGMLPFSGKGGNSLLLNTLKQSFEDTEDPNRPPFDQGDEYVGGFVVYMGTETAGEAEKFWNLVKPLFSVQVPTAVENAWVRAGEILDASISETERQINVLDDLSAEFGKLPSTPPEKNAIGADLAPSFEDGTVENKPRVITFGDSLEPTVKKRL